MIKYKMAFTVPAEVLFGLLAKVLPIEDLSVEELVERPPPAKPKMVAAPKQIERKKRRKPAHEIQLDRGANGIILELFADGRPHRAVELKPLFEARGLSSNGVGSALEKLKRRGLVSQPEMGLWRKVG